MPREARPLQAVTMEKQRILSVAAELIRTHGFNALSMRRLAKETGMTAANLYNYVSGKDHIYLEIQKTGFNQLKEDLLQKTSGAQTPKDKLRHAAMAYIRFAVENPDLYKVMFAMETPKFADYRDTDLEGVAQEEKEAGLGALAVAMACLEEANPNADHQALHNKGLFLWSSLHGIANLLLSRILQEVTEDTEAYIAYAVDRLIEDRP